MSPRDLSVSLALGNRLDAFTSGFSHGFQRSNSGLQGKYLSTEPSSQSKFRAFMAFLILLWFPSLVAGACKSFSRPGQLVPLGGGRESPALRDQSRQHIPVPVLLFATWSLL